MGRWVETVKNGLQRNVVVGDRGLISGLHHNGIQRHGNLRPAAHRKAVPQMKAPT